MNPRLIGYGLAILGVLIISPDSALLRKVAMEPWALLFWRGCGVFGVSAVLSVIFYRMRLWDYFRDTGWLGLLISLVFFGSTCCFVYSALTINPIILLIFVALSPVSGAIFSIVLINEPPRPAVWIAIAISLVGLGIVVTGEGLETGAFEALANGGTVALPPVPSMIAVFGVFSLLGLSFTLTRKIRQPNIWPSNAISGLMAIGVMYFVAKDLTIPDGIMLEFSFLIIMVSGVSFIFISMAPRFISSAETSLVFLLETVLGSLWIWWLLGQRPELHEIAGGAVVTVAAVVVVLSAVKAGKQHPEAE